MIRAPAAALLLVFGVISCGNAGRTSRVLPELCERVGDGLLREALLREALRFEAEDDIPTSERPGEELFQDDARVSRMEEDQRLQELRSNSKARMSELLASMSVRRPSCVQQCLCTSAFTFWLQASSSAVFASF